MPFLNKEQRKAVKELLDDVMTDKDLTDQFNGAQKRQQQVQSDYTDAMLRQYMGIIREIQNERAARKPPRADATGPSLEQLKKKYPGPGKK